MDGGFKTTGLGPWTYLLSPSMVDSGAFWHKTSGTSDDAYAAPTEASLLESGVPNTPTHPLNYPEELGAQLELKNYLVYFQHSDPARKKCSICLAHHQVYGRGAGGTELAPFHYDPLSR